MNRHSDRKETSQGYDRRKFIKLTAMASTTVLLPSCFSDSDQKPIRFGLMTDSHYADREPWLPKHRYYREGLVKMKDCINTLNQEKVDFVMHMGDFKDENENQRSEDTLKYLIELEEEYAQFDGPRFHCVGNHDVDSITKEQFLSNIENTGISKQSSYYSFDKNGFHFVVLDANFREDGSHQYYKDGDDWQDTRILDDQLNWLKNDLDATTLDTIVFCHHPLYEFIRDDYKFHINNYKEVQEILASSKKVKAIFQGHVHEEKYKEIDGIHYCTHNAMSDYSGLENNSFSIVTLEKDMIKIDGYKRSSDVTYPPQS